GAVNLYYNDFSDFIFQAFTGAEVDGFPVSRWTQADAELWGAEIDATVLLAQRAHASWDLDLLWDLVRGELASGGDLPRMPPQRFGVGIHYRGDRIRGGVDVRWVADQDRVAANETPTDGYTMVNASFAYRLFFERQLLDLILRGTNLTDEDARNHVSFVKDDVPLPGRNVALIARLGF
ncbi:MAG: TonB-dependent receptor, partial [Thermoanaerobaculia bacterium]|nr:TonB-dependent receptor [Thermoanaerobaculia bacterium]